MQFKARGKDYQVVTKNVGECEVSVDYLEITAAPYYYASIEITPEVKEAIQAAIEYGKNEAKKEIQQVLEVL